MVHKFKVVLEHEKRVGVRGRVSKTGSSIGESYIVGGV